jgi:hypothetical protein
VNDIAIEPEWLVAGAALLVLGTGGYVAYGAYQRRSRRKGLLARLERIGYQAAHQVLVPDGMGGFIHIDHLLLTPRGVLVLDTRRVAGLIFGGDQMSDWTVMGRGRRYTFDNPATGALRPNRGREGAGGRCAGRRPTAVLQSRASPRASRSTW